MPFLDSFDQRCPWYTSRDEGACIEDYFSFMISSTFARCNRCFYDWTLLDKVTTLSTTMAHPAWSVIVYVLLRIR